MTKSNDDEPLTPLEAMSRRLTARLIAAGAKVNDSSRTAAGQGDAPLMATFIPAARKKVPSSNPTSVRRRKSTPSHAEQVKELEERKSMLMFAVMQRLQTGKPDSPMLERGIKEVDEELDALRKQG